MNPLIPDVTDVIWALAFIVNFALVVAALISLARAPERGQWFTTVLLIVFLPFVGPVVALVANRSKRSVATSS